MARLLRVLIALAVGVTTLLVAHPAGAAGDTYTWVGDPAPQPDLFSDPANWERVSDGGSGVPGPLDDAVIVDPRDAIAVADPVTVRSLEVDAIEDGDVDLGIIHEQGGSLSAQTVSLSGDTIVDNLTTSALHTSGSMEVGSGAPGRGINLVAASEGVVPQLVLDDLTTADIVQLDDGPVEVSVEGTEPSTVEAIVVPVVTLHLTSDEGGEFDGKVFGGDVIIAGDVPADATVYGGDDWASGPGTISWTGPDSVIAGHVWVSGTWTASLPEHLTINGILDLVGPATGGSVDIGAEGALRFTDRGPDGHRVADLVLTGTFASDPTGGIWIDPADTTCVGDEDLLVRAAGGVTFPPGEVHLDAPETWFDLEGVALGDELVAVARRTDDDVQDQCIGGASERVVRSMYRDLLGRRGDGGGAAYWAGKLDGGVPATTVAARLLSTEEAWVHLVRSTWEAWSCDGEPPSDEAVGLTVAYLRGGGALSTLRADVVAGTIPSGGDPVECLYQAALGRAPDPGGRAYAEARLERESVQKVARRLITSPEGRRVRINRLYQPLLGRAATSGEVTVRIAQLRQGRTEVRVVEQIAGTDEYVERASR